MRSVTKDYPGGVAWWERWLTVWPTLTEAAAIWAEFIELWPPELSADWSQSADVWTTGIARTAEDSVAWGELLKGAVVGEELAWKRFLNTKGDPARAISMLKEGVSIWEERAATWSEEAAMHSRIASETASLAASFEEIDVVELWLEKLSEQMELVAEWLGAAAHVSIVRKKELTKRLEQLSRG